MATLKARKLATAEEQQQFGTGKFIDVDISADEAEGYKAGGYEIIGLPKQDLNPAQISTPKVKEPLVQAPIQPKQQPISSPSADLPDEVKTMFQNTNALQEQQIQTVQDQYEKMKEFADAQLTGIINNINDSMNSRLREQKVLNQARLGGQTKLGFRSGRARYAPEIQSSILGKEESEGLARLNSIEVQRQGLIGQAKSAALESDWKMFNESFTKINALQQQKQETLLNQYALAKQAEEQAYQRSRQAIQDEREAFKFNLELENSLKEQESELASIVISDLVSLDENFNVIRPSDEEVNSLADELGVSSILLSSLAKQKANELESFSLDQRKGQYDLLNTQSVIQNRNFQQSLAEREFQLKKEQLDFQNELDIEELKIRASDLQGAAMQLSPQQIQDAVNKGYKSESELRLYASQLSGGVEPASLKKISTEQKKLESLVISGLNDVSTLRDKLAASFGRGKFNDAIYKQAEDNLTDVIGRLRSGGAITSDEEKRFLRLLPSGIRTDKTNTEKLRNLENYLIDAIGQDRYNEKKKEVYADFTSFTRMGSAEERRAWDDFLDDVGAGPNDDLDDWFAEYRQEQGYGFSSERSFNQVGSDTNQAVEGGVLSLGKITGFGSPLWKHGLDIDLKKGDPVPSPVDGTVEFVGNNGGFGKQVRVTDAKGNSIWLSHLDGYRVKKGDRVKAGQVVGLGGNTGKTIPGPNGDGSHLDLTVKTKTGEYMDPKEIYNKLKSFV